MNNHVNIFSFEQILKNLINKGGIKMNKEIEQRFSQMFIEKSKEIEEDEIEL